MIVLPDLQLATMVVLRRNHEDFFDDDGGAGASSLVCEASRVRGLIERRQ